MSTSAPRGGCARRMVKAASQSARPVVEHHRDGEVRDSLGLEARSTTVLGDEAVVIDVAAASFACSAASSAAAAMATARA